MTLAALMAITKEVEKGFDRPPWTKEAWTIDMVEEVGELCNAVLVSEGHKNPKRAKAELADSFCDILFDLFVLADLYKVDLDSEYHAMLARLRERQQSGDFSG